MFFMSLAAAAAALGSLCETVWGGGEAEPGSGDTGSIWGIGDARSDRVRPPAGAGQHHPVAELDRCGAAEGKDASQLVPGCGA